MQTLKIKYSLNDPSDSDIILSYMKAYSSCLHYMFNRVKDSSLNELSCRKLYQSKQINNIDIFSSWFVQSSIREAISICCSLESKKSGSLIFGGRGLFKKRIKGQISKEEFRVKRLSPIYSIGTSGKNSMKGNTKFYLNQDLKTVLFKPSRYVHIDLILPNLKPNYKKILSRLFVLQERKSIPISYKLDLDYVYIVFDEERLNEGFKQQKQIKNRVLGIDLNPNYIGWSITDWTSETEFRAIKSGIYSLKKLNDRDISLDKSGLSSSSRERKYISNKREHEVYEISKNLINIALKYQVSLVSVEDLSSMKSKDNKKGKGLNRLINNQWDRSKFRLNLEKKCKIFKIKFLKIQPQYSSFIGNILYRNLGYPDPVLSSIEIGRRGFEYLQQYILKTKESRKNIIFPDPEKFSEAITESLEEFGVVEGFKGWKEMFDLFKDSKLWYRVPVSIIETGWSEFKSRKSNVGVVYLSN